MEAVIRNEPNLTLMLNTRAYGVTLQNGAMPRPLQLNEFRPIRRGKRRSVRYWRSIFDRGSGSNCRLQSSSTVPGMAGIGYYAGAEYRQGQESRSQHNEALAPLVAGDRTQGNTLYNSVLVTP